MIGKFLSRPKSFQRKILVMDRIWIRVWSIKRSIVSWCNRLISRDFTWRTQVRSSSLDGEVFIPTAGNIETAGATKVFVPRMVFRFLAQLSNTLQCIVSYSEELTKKVSESVILRWWDVGDMMTWQRFCITDWRTFAIG